MYSKEFLYCIFVIIVCVVILIGLALVLIAGVPKRINYLEEEIKKSEFKKENTN